MTVTEHHSLPEQAYSVASVRELDRRAIEDHGIPGIRLMHRAGKALFQAILTSWPEARSVLVLCGGGNNGGDGYIVAGLAARRGLTVTLWALAEPGSLSGDAALARDFAADAGVEFQPWATQSLNESGADVVVDALLGTGFRGELRPAYRRLIDALNDSALPVIAADVPSGLDADTGAVAGIAVHCDLTVTFIGVKRGLLTGRARDFIGELLFDDLQVPAAVYRDMTPAADVLTYPELFLHWGPRARCAHKGDFGHALLIGGDAGMGGAVLMAAEAAARTGAGLTSAFTRSAHVAPGLQRRPEIMIRACDDVANATLPPKVTALGVGPGLGQADWGRDALQWCLRQGVPAVLDADALNLMADGAARLPEGEWVLTPHPGEAAKLLACGTAEVEADRYAAVAALSERFNAVVVLKGAGTLIGGRDGAAVCVHGNPGMASGGMGDVLTGIIAGLLAQGFSPETAAKLGVALHGAAADRAALQGERGLLATDLFEPLRALVNGL